MACVADAFCTVAVHVLCEMFAMGFTVSQFLGFAAQTRSVQLAKALTAWTAATTHGWLWLNSAIEYDQKKAM